MEGKGTGNKKHNKYAQNKQGEVKNSIGNGEATELVCITHGHGLSTGGDAGGLGVQGRGGEWGEKNWDNCSTINKIYFKKEKKRCRNRKF